MKTQPHVPFLLRSSLVSGLLILVSSTLHGQDSTDVTILQRFNVVALISPPDVYKSECNADSNYLKLGAVNLVDILHRTSPVFIKSYGTNGISLVNLRGGKPGHTRVFWNGLDLTYPSLGESDISLIPASAFNNVAIQYGPGKGSAASGGLGGNIELYQGRSKYQTELQVFDQVSSMKNNDARFRFEQQFKNTRLLLFGEQSVGKNEFNYINPTKPGWPKETMQYANFSQYAAGFQINQSGKRSVFTIGGWYRSGNRNVPPLNTQETYYGEKYHDEIGALNAVFGKRTKNSIDFKASTGSIWALNNYSNPQTNLDASNETFSWQNQVEARKLLNVKSWMLIWKAQVRHVFNLANSRSYDHAEDMNGYSAFLSADLFDNRKWRLITSVRTEYQLETFSGLLPSVVLSYRPKGGNLLFSTTWNSNVKFPTLNQLYWQPGGNPDLLPEKGNMAEVSIQYHRKFKKLLFEFRTDAYLGSYDNWISWQPQGTFWSPLNIKKVNTKGLESSFGLLFKHKSIEIDVSLKTSLNESVNASSDNQDLLGNLVIYAPQFQGSFLTVIKIKKWEFSWFQPITGKYFITTDNSVYMPMYIYANATVGRSININRSEFFLLFGVDNLCDCQYQVIPNRPMPGRQFKLSLQYKFRK